MDSDVSKRTVVLEGFPQTDQPERDIYTLINNKFGIRPVKLRLQDTPHLTTSNTPNWTLLCNSVQDACSICHENIQYHCRGASFLLKTRICFPEEITGEWTTHGPAQTESMVSIGDSLMSVNVEPQDPGDAPGDEVQELQSLIYDVPEGQAEGPPESLVSINPGYPSSGYQGQEYHHPCQPGFPQTPNPESMYGMLRGESCVDMRAQEPHTGLTFHSEDSVQKSEHHKMLHSQSAPTLDMGNELGPPTYRSENMIEVHGSDVSSSGEDKYRYFFENPRKGGGDIEDFQVTEDNILLIAFKDPSVAHKLAEEGKIKVGETQVTIKQHIPTPLYKKKVLLEYEGAHLDQFSTELHYYIEARSKRELTKAEAGSKQDAVLLTFQEAVDIEKLQSACRQRPFKGKTISVRVVPATSVLQIHGVPNSMSSDTIQNYFETRRSGNDTNSEVIKVNALEENGAYLVHFGNYLAIGRILNKESHILGNHPVTVCLYHKCIGSISSRHIQQTRKGPSEEKLLRLDQVDKLIVRFLSKSQPLMTEMNQKLRDQKITLSIVRDRELYVKCEDMSVQHDAKYNERIQRVVTSAIAKNVALYRLQIPVDLKAKVDSKIAEIGINPTVAKAYTGVGNVAIVGSTAKAAELKEKLETFLQTAVVIDKKADVAEEMTGVTEQTAVVTERQTASKVKPLEACFLSAMNFEENVRKSFPGIKVKVDLQANEVYFEGPEDKVTEAKLKMFEIINAGEIIEVQNISEEQISLLEKTDVTNEVLLRLKEKGITAAWMRKQSAVEVISNSKSGAEEAKRFILTTVIERVFQLESNMLSLLSSESWYSLNNQLTEVFPDRFSITNVTDKNYLLIVGMNSNVDNVYDAVRGFFTANVVDNTVVGVSRGVFRFIQAHFRKEVEMISKALKVLHVQICYKDAEPKFIVHGSEEGIKECKHRLDQLISKVKHHKEPMQKAGMAKMLTSEKGATMVSYVERLERCTIEVGTEATQEVSSGSTMETEPIATVVAVTNLPESRKIYVRQGNITSFRVGAIVNAANNRLDHCGGLAKAIVDKGPGNLPCDVIIHAVGPRWQDGSHREKEYLTEAVIKCMELTESRSCVSVAIPGLSTGIFGYPTDAATKVISATVRDYFRQNRDSVIRDVYFCDNDSNTINGFVKAMKAVFGEGNTHIQPQRAHGSGTPSSVAVVQRTHVRQPSASQSSGSHVTLVKGKIAEQKADVIVNTTNQKLQLREAGAVSKSLLETAGPELQFACSRGHPQGITPGSIAVTRGGKLQCKRVYHVFLPAFSTDHQAKKDVRDLVMKCLTNAGPHRTSSVAFPALGTGGLNYPRELVADSMFTAIQDYWTQNPGSPIKDVRIVLYEQDQQTITAFENQKVKYGHGAQHKQASGSVHRRPDLVRGSITRFQADVIVNPTDGELDMNSGPLSRSIAEAAGPGLVSEIKHKFPYGVPQGGLAVTSAGHLHAKVIYHVVVKQWNLVRTIQPLSNAVTMCLEEAHKSNYTSILFPTLGIGSRDYDKATVAKTMYGAIDAFWTNNPGTTLTHIKIVIYYKDHDVAKIFEQEKMAFYQMSNSRKGRQLKGSLRYPESEEPVYDVSGGVTFGNIQFKLVHGDLLKERVDCIINNVHSEFDLNKGMINQAILRKLGHQIQNGNQQNVEDLRTKGLTITEVSGVPFNKIIHFEEFYFKHDVKKILKKCIKEADKTRCASVALPALGQGPEGGVPEHRFFEYLYDTMIGLSNLTHVTEVHLVVLERPMYERFIDLLDNLLDTQGLKGKSIIQRMKGAAFGSSTVPPKRRSHSAHTRHVSEDDPETGLDVSFFSDTQEAIQAAQQKLQDAYDKEFGNIVKDIEALKTLDGDKIQRLHNEAKQRGVSIDVNPRLGRIQVQGIKDDASAMVQRTYEICLQQKDDEKAEILGSVVQWYYMDILEEEELVKYDSETNKEIEKAFKENRKSHVLEDTDGNKYVVDFEEMVEYREDDHSARCPLIRKDLIKAAEFDPPPSWEDMATTENLKVFRVSPSSDEHARVSAKFASANRQIVKIERIQNKTLYKQYQAKKQSFQHRSSNTKRCETELWHGTATDAIHSINKDGYNRSYCGKNAVMYGLGVYFAVNATYSTQDRYARPDVMGNKYIYLVDVLTGEYTQGKSGMRVPPPVDPAFPSVLHDSVVDNVNNPSMFVIFNDTQAYPKYLITFK